MMDFIQLVFEFANVSLFATFLLGMFWKRTTGHLALGVNVNLGWGCVLLVFGGCMLAMARWARRRARKVELSQRESQQREQGNPFSFKGNL